MSGLEDASAERRESKYAFRNLRMRSAFTIDESTEDPRFVQKDNLPVWAFCFRRVLDGWDYQALPRGTDGEASTFFGWVRKIDIERFHEKRRARDAKREERRIREQKEFDERTAARRALQERLQKEREEFDAEQATERAEKEARDIAARAQDAREELRKTLAALGELRETRRLGDDIRRELRHLDVTSAEARAAFIASKNTRATCKPPLQKAVDELQTLLERHARKGAFRRTFAEWLFDFEEKAQEKLKQAWSEAERSRQESEEKIASLKVAAQQARKIIDASTGIPSGLRRV